MQECILDKDVFMIMVILVALMMMIVTMIVKMMLMIIMMFCSNQEVDEQLREMERLIAEKRFRLSSSFL